MVKKLLARLSEPKMIISLAIFAFAVLISYMVALRDAKVIAFFPKFFRYWMSALTISVTWVLLAIYRHLKEAKLLPQSLLLIGASLVALSPFILLYFTK